MFCPKCGNELIDGALFCGNCGNKLAETPNPQPQAAPETQYVAAQPSQPYAQQQYTQAQSVAPVGSNNTLIQVIKIFLIIACVINGICGFLIPLAWCIPMTLSINKSLKNGTPISMAMKICTLLFVSLVSGVCLLVLKDDEPGYNR